MQFTRSPTYAKSKPTDTLQRGRKSISLDHRRAGYHPIRAVQLGGCSAEGGPQAALIGLAQERRHDHTDAGDIAPVVAIEASASCAARRYGFAAAQARSE